MAGIHGREEEGAYSIVLSGGYEDDVVSWLGKHCSFVHSNLNVDSCSGK